MSLKSNQGKIPEFTMVNRPILDSSKRSYKINKSPEKQLKKNEKETQNKQNKQKRKKWFKKQANKQTNQKQQ